MPPAPKKPRNPSLFPSKLKQERKRLGLTQAALAEEMETTETTIARWERGDVTPLPVFEKAILTMLSVFPGHKQPEPKPVEPEASGT